jgi:hypothetical protein
MSVTLESIATSDNFSTAALSSGPTGAVQRGDLLVALFLYQDFGSGSTTLAVTDDAGNAYTTSYALAETNQFWMAIAWAIAAADVPGGVTMTATMGASRFFSTLSALVVRSSLGPFTAPPTNGAPNAAGTNSALADVPLVLVVPGFVAALLASPAPPSTPGAGYSIVATSPGFSYETLWGPAIGAGAQDVTATFTAGKWGMVAEAFREPMVGVVDPVGFGAEL